MAKLTEKERRNRTVRLLGFKWELLRRNEEYQADYKKYMEIQLQPGYGTTAEGRALYEEKYKRQREFITKWGIAPCDPELSLEDFKGDKKGGKKGDKGFEGSKGWLNALSKNHKNPIVSQSIVFPFQKTRDDKVYDITFELFDRVNLTLDLVFPKEEILGAVSSLIDEYKKRQKHNIARKRNIEAQYKQYLVIYDLRKKGLPWQKIADKVYPQDSDLNSSIRKVIRNYKSCEDLIKNYQKIR